MHAAYSQDVFVKTCPSDQEILLHWLDRPEMAKLPYEEHKRLSHETPRYSLDVPAFAALVTIEWNFQLSNFFHRLTYSPIQAPI